MITSLFIFGQGYTGTWLSNYLKTQNISVIGTHSKQFPKFNEQENEINEQDILSCSHILISIPPIAGQDLVYTKLLPILKKSTNLKWLGYLSTIGVYGDCQGAWVNENSPINPNDNRSLERAKIEQQWLNSNLPIHVFRLSAIYGPGRSAITELQKGTARIIFKEGQVFNRCHVSDIVQILFKSMNKPNPGSIYNVADDMPASNKDVIYYACDLLNVSKPPVENYLLANISDYHRSYFLSCRRVSNRKIKEELGISFVYPTYKEGISAISTIEANNFNLSQ